jgi:hypothetical protein
MRVVRSSAQWLVVGAAIAILLVAYGAIARGAAAQTVSFTVEPLAAGAFGYAEAVGGPAVNVVQHIVVPPGARTGWQAYSGPVWLLATQGDLILYTADGCFTGLTMGRAYQAEPNVPLDIRNETPAQATLVLTGLAPVGQPLQTNVSSSTAVCSP